MSKLYPSSGDEGAAASMPSQSRQDHDVLEGDKPTGRDQAIGGAADPHPAWLQHWRNLRSGLDRHGASSSQSEKLRELQSSIAHTPADTLSGLQAQAELISELAWNDLVAAAARQLLKGIKRLQRLESG